jgi:hypothetical protein
MERDRVLPEKHILLYADRNEVIINKQKQDYTEERK